MFSVDNLYHILQQNLLFPLKINCFQTKFVGDKFHEAFIPTMSNVAKDTGMPYGWLPSDHLHIFFWDQEPFKQELFDDAVRRENDLFLYYKAKAIAYSDVCATTVSDDNWYYFFHGFAALDWYRDVQYFDNLKNKKFTKVFITLNRLVTQDRSYRLWLVAALLERDLDQQGLVSCALQDSFGGTWKNEIFDTKSQLTKEQRKLIYRQFSKLTSDLNLDFDSTPGAASAEMGVQQMKLFQQAFVHLVTETVYYPNNLHLTEKIFRPIVVYRPFILVGAPGNLEYLKRYGFQTFDQWWDESYDQEPDPERRLAMVVEQVERLCQLSPSELDTMYQEMLPVLQHNRDHFYGKFRQIIVDEMLDNFVVMIDKFNQKQGSVIHDVSQVDINNLKQLLGR